jgi:hypothetical protein
MTANATAQQEQLTTLKNFVSQSIPDEKKDRAADIANLETTINPVVKVPTTTTSGGDITTVFVATKSNVSKKNEFINMAEIVALIIQYAEKADLSTINHYNVFDTHLTKILVRHVSVAMSQTTPEALALKSFWRGASKLTRGTDEEKNFLASAANYTVNDVNYSSNIKQSVYIVTAAFASHFFIYEALIFNSQGFSQVPPELYSTTLTGCFNYIRFRVQSSAEGCTAYAAFPSRKDRFTKCSSGAAAGSSNFQISSLLDVAEPHNEDDNSKNDRSNSNNGNNRDNNRNKSRRAGGGNPRGNHSNSEISHLSNRDLQKLAKLLASERRRSRFDDNDGAHTPFNSGNSNNNRGGRSNGNNNNNNNNNSGNNNNSNNNNGNRAPGSNNNNSFGNGNGNGKHGPPKPWKPGMGTSPEELARLAEAKSRAYGDKFCDRCYFRNTGPYYHNTANCPKYKADYSDI